MDFNIRGRRHGYWMKIIVAVIFLIATVVALAFMFRAFVTPYKQKEVYTLDQNWAYYVNNEPVDIQHSARRRVPNAKAGEHIFMHRTLPESPPGASLLIRGHHQYIRLLLNGQEFYTLPNDLAVANPGYTMEFIPLPEGYQGKTLTLEFWSGYRNYAGAIPGVHIGDIPSLEAFVLSQSIVQLSIFFICSGGGLLFVVLGLVAGFTRTPKWDMFFLGLFSVMWGLYSFMGEYISLQYFSALTASNIRFVLHLTYHIPLLLYLQCIFTRFNKIFLPTIWLSILCSVVALVLSGLGVVPLIDCFVVITPLYQLILFYTLVLVVAEYFYKNPVVRTLLPWTLLALIVWIVMTVDFYWPFLSARTNSNIYHLSFFYIIFVFWINTLVQRYRAAISKSREISILETKNKLAQESYDVALNHVEQVAIVRHEINNQLTTLGYLLKNKDFEKAEIYLAVLTQNNQTAEKPVYCEHYLVNSILVSKLSSLAQREIQVKVKVAIPSELKIIENDLCSLLVNMLDNAIEACVAMPQNSVRWLKVIIHMREPYLFVHCSNSKQGQTHEEKGRFVSSKPDGKMHGYGVRIIRRLTARYDGIVDFLYTENQFDVTAALKNQLPLSQEADTEMEEK